MGKERSLLEGIVTTIDKLTSGVADAQELLELAIEENDADTVAEVSAEVEQLDGHLAQLEFRRMFSGEMDPNSNPVLPPSAHRARRLP